MLVVDAHGEARGSKGNGDVARIIGIWLRLPSRQPLTGFIWIWGYYIPRHAGVPFPEPNQSPPAPRASIPHHHTQTPAPRASFPPRHLWRGGGRKAEGEIKGGQQAGGDVRS